MYIYAHNLLIFLSHYKGETLHGVVYLPSIVEEGVKYPTVLYVYGGPEFQVRVHVTCTYLLIPPF